MGSATIFGAGLRNSDDFQSYPLVIDLNCEPGAYLIFIKSVVVQIVTVSLPYSFKNHYGLIVEILETLADMPAYDLCMWNSQTMKIMCKVARIPHSRRYSKKSNQNTAVRKKWR